MLPSVLIAGLLIAAPETGFAQIKPAYSDGGASEVVFSTTDETSKARCGDDTACEPRCSDPLSYARRDPEYASIPEGREFKLARARGATPSSSI